MYQFMVATRSGINVRPGNSTWTGPGTDAGDISTMSLTSGTNKWASRAVVALQLAAWSAVGIVLLEKGIASLQKRPDSLNVSHEITSMESSETMFDKGLEKPIGIGNLSPDETEPGTGLFSVIPLVLDEDNTITANSNSPKNAETDDSRIINRRGESADDDKPAEAQQEIDVIDKIVNKNHRLVVQVNNGFASKVDRESETVETSPTIKAVMENSSEKTLREMENERRWKNRKRSRFSKVGAGGAAAAVAMVAVGAVMLILGPAVIILRALDERRQERRFLKLSGEEDLPPSYEQATGNSDLAPTYSSLNLDTIVTSLPSSPPSLHNSTYLRDQLESTHSS